MESRCGWGEAMRPGQWGGACGGAASAGIHNDCLEEMGADFAACAAFLIKHDRACVCCG